MENEAILSSAEVASRLGVTSQTVTRLSRNGELNYALVGKRRVYRENDVISFMRKKNLCFAPADHRATEVVDSTLTAVSFFSGALGLDYGMERTGISSSLFCENDTKCRMTIASNRPNVGLLGDINKVTPDRVFDYSGISPKRGIDVMFGGPPCQAFSTAGARRAFDDVRGNVFLKYLDLADHLRPKYLIIENVRGLLSTAYPLEAGGEPVHGGAMKTVLNKLESMGYGVSFNLYNAANFGAPQIRERVVLIAKRDGSICDWLTPTNSNDPKWQLDTWKTFSDAVGGLKGEQHYVQFSEKRLKYFHLLKEGEYWKNLPEDIQEEAMGKAYRLGGGKTGFYRRIWNDRPSPTLVTSPTMPATDLCHPTEDRPLSIEEYRAIQGFPEDWIFRGDISDIYRQIGNAVPIALGEAIGRAILKDISKSKDNNKEMFKGFPYSRYKNSNQLTWSIR